MSSGVVCFVTVTGMVGRSMRAFLVLAITLGAVAATQLPTTVQAAAAEQHFAVVRLTIEQADGKVLRATRTIPWGEAATFELGEAHRHVVAITPGDAHMVSVDYARDGADVLDGAEVQAQRGSTVVHSDATSTVAVRVLRTTARLETSPI
jgi:hypothetical protein